MPNNKPKGDAGEKEVVRRVPCPNCGRKLMLMPKNYPMYDIQCTACNFRAQVKTNHTRPHREIFGATWQIMNKVLKAGYLVPALFVLFKWSGKGGAKSELRFYPFIPKHHLKPYKTYIKKQKRRLEMFNYRSVDTIPYFIFIKDSWEKA